MDLGLILCLYNICLLIELFALGIANDFDLSVFNPYRNYKKWKDLDWFKAAMLTIILNILFLPYAICYWFYYFYTKD